MRKRQSKGEVGEGTTQVTVAHRAIARDRASFEAPARRGDLSLVVEADEAKKRARSERGRLGSSARSQSALEACNAPQECPDELLRRFEGAERRRRGEGHARRQDHSLLPTLWPDVPLISRFLGISAHRELRIADDERRARERADLLPRLLASSCAR